MTHARRVISFINVAHVIDHMFMLIFPAAVLGMSGAFDMSYGELLRLSVGGFIAFGAGSIPSGWLGDKWSQRNMMAVFFIGIGGAVVLTGFAQSPLALAASLTLVGLFGSIYHPVGTSMLTAHAEKLGREIGINGVWGNLGVAFAALFTGALMQAFDWRVAFIVPGLVSIAIGIAYLMLVPDQPAARKTARRSPADLPRSVLVRAFGVLAVVSITGSIVFNATTVSMPKVFEDRLVALVSTPLGIGITVAIVYTVGAMSQLIVGRLIDRHTLRSVFLPLSFLQAPCLLLAAFATDWAMIAVAMGMMFAVFGQATINDAMVARYTTERWRARAFAVRYLVSFAASACAVPLVAFLHDRTNDFTLTFQVLSALGLTVFLGAVFFPHRPDELDQAVPAASPATR